MPIDTREAVVRLSDGKVRDVFILIELQIKTGTVLLSGSGILQVSEKEGCASKAFNYFLESIFARIVIKK